MKCLSVALLIALWMGTAALSWGQEAQEKPQFLGKIVMFGARRAGSEKMAILSMNPDGSNLETVREMEPAEIHGRISPDGWRLAFGVLTAKDEQASVEILESDGESQRIPGGGFVMAWSPEGDSVACYRLARKGWKSAIVDLRSREIQTLELPADDAVEDWSPKEDQLSIMVGNREHVVKRGENDIYPLRKLDLAALNGSNRQRITTDPQTDNIWSRFSPDGSKILHYQRIITNNEALESFVSQPLDGGKPVEWIRFGRLTPDLKLQDSDLDYPFYWTPTGPACWSPDGKRIAVIVDNGKWRGYQHPRPEMRFGLLIITEEGRVERAWDLKDFRLVFPGKLDWR